MHRNALQIFGLVRLEQDLHIENSRLCKFHPKVTFALSGGSFCRPFLSDFFAIEAHGPRCLNRFAPEMARVLPE
jgi:hypothetical protein